MAAKGCEPRGGGRVRSGRVRQAKHCTTKASPVTVLLVVDDGVHDACPLRLPARPRAPSCSLSLPTQRLFCPQTHLSRQQPARQDRPPDQREDGPSRAQWLLRLQGSQQAARRGVGGQRKGALLAPGGHRTAPVARVALTSTTRHQDLHKGRQKLKRHLHQWRAAQPRGARVRAVRAQDRRHRRTCRTSSYDAPRAPCLTLHPQEFGIDIVGEDNKTIVHHKVAARVVCVFTELDAQAAQRAEAQAQQQGAQGYINAMPNQPGAGNSAFNFVGNGQGSSNGAAGPQRRPTLQSQGLVGMGGMGGNVRVPGKSGLTFDHILSRLQGELQKSRETGAELHSLSSGLAEIHDTLGGNLVSARLYALSPQT